MKYLKYLPLLIFLYACGSSVESIPKKPNPIKYYNDFTGSNFLTAEQATTIENKLVAFEKETSNEIVVVIVNDFGGMEPAEFGAKLGAEWGVGQKESDNGVVLLVKTSEKRKVFISTGRGTGTMLTDAIAKDIVDNQIIPSFKSKDFYQGIDNGINGIISSLGGNTVEPAAVPDATSNNSASENLTTNEPTANTNYDNQVTDLSESEKDLYDTSEFQILLITFGLGTLIYFVGWLFFGIDPRKGKIQANNDSLTDLSPALVNVIYSKKFDYSEIIKAGILSLVVKNFVQIIIQKKSTKLRLIQHESQNENELTTEELILLNFLRDNSHLEHKDKDSRIFYLPHNYSKKYDSLKDEINKKFIEPNKKVYFRENLAFSGIGCIFHIVSLFFFYSLFGVGWSILFFLGIAGLSLLMGQLIFKYTKLGRAKMDRIKSLEIYLKSKNVESSDIDNHISLFAKAIAMNKVTDWFNILNNHKTKNTLEIPWLENNNDSLCLETFTLLNSKLSDSINIATKKPESKSSWGGGSSNSSWGSSSSGGSDFGGGDFGGGGAGGDW
jgi:uncharacterized membrane protein YgcG